MLSVASSSIHECPTVIARTPNGYVFCKPWKRNTWELISGNRYSHETIMDTVKRRLRSQAGITDADIRPICQYDVKTTKQGEPITGVLYLADIDTCELKPHKSIERLAISKILPLEWTYPDIEPLMLREACNRNFIPAFDA